VVGATFATFIIAAIAVWATARGNGPFAEANALRNATLLQLFVAVISISGQMLAAVIAERSRAEEIVSEKAKLLDLANDATLIRALDDTLTYWNRGAERLYGWTNEEVLGRPVQEILRTESHKPLSEIKAQILRDGSWEGELVHFQRNGNRIFVVSRWALWAKNGGEPLGFLELNTDVTERKRAEESLRSLSGRLLRLQDEERRWIARELHDSAGQTLVAPALNIASVQAETKPQSATAHACRESLDLIEGLTQELRTISYLLHPPLLDEAGLPAAIRWYVEGFAARSKIPVEVEIAPDLERMRPETETAIFRLIQEGLTNIHRHSGSPTATVRIMQDAEALTVEVQDRGEGMPATASSAQNRTIGVGVQGMRERVRQLGGGFEINSGKEGTAVVAILPLSGTSAFAISDPPAH
jgi:PAS domain S-box-containing protein